MPLVAPVSASGHAIHALQSCHQVTSVVPTIRFSRALQSLQSCYQVAPVVLSMLLADAHRPKRASASDGAHIRIVRNACPYRTARMAVVSPVVYEYLLTSIRV